MIRFPPSSPALACALATVLLSGCAAQMAFKEGQDLVGKGRNTEGLAKLEEASRLSPGVAEYRMAMLQTRERFLLGQLEAADNLRRQGNLSEAEQAYRQVLSQQGSNERALAGLRALDQSRRGEALLKEATAAIDKKDVDTARQNLRAALSENPGFEPASRLLRQLDKQAAKPATETVLSSAYRKPITIEFKDAALRSVFEVISRTSGLNFLFDKDVRTDQKTSIFLKNSTIEAAVNLTLLTNQLEQRVLDANTVLIYPNTQAKQKDYQSLTVKSFYLANTEAKTVAATLKTLLKTRDIVVDEKLNLLILRDSPEAIRLAEKLVALHDVAEPEVMLEVEILEVKRTRLLDLGIRWPDQLSLAPLPGTSGALRLSDLRGINSAGLGATIGPVSINAKKTDTGANILANPRIRARNREKAKILIGDRVPNITATSTSTGFVAESINYVDVGLKLDVEPTIYLDGEVAIKIALEVSSIVSRIETKSGSVAYQIGTRTAQTVLRLKDGENQVLAGLINDEDRRSANKVPGLGEVPVLGRLFGNQADDSSKTEIVLSITPRIIRNIQRPEASITEFDSGTENSLGARSAPSGGSGAVNTPPPPTRPAANPGNGQRQAPGTPTGSQSGGAGGTSSEGTVRSPVPTANAAAPAALRWQGPTSLKVGDTFAVQLMIQSEQPLVSIPLAVGFDPKVLQVTSIVEGDFLRQGGAQAGFSSRIDPNGQVLITGTRSGDTGATAPGAIATLNFRVGAATSPVTRIQLLTISPIGLGGKGVAAPLPPPHTVIIGTGTSDSLRLRPALALTAPQPAAAMPLELPATALASMSER